MVHFGFPSRWLRAAFVAWSSTWLLTACVSKVCPLGTESVNGQCKKRGDGGAGDASTKGVDGGSSRSAALASHAPDASGGRDAGGGLDAGDAAPLSDTGVDSGGSPVMPTCDAGYVLQGKDCVRDVCIAITGEPAACGDHGACKNGTAATPTCICDDGYVEEQAQCVRNPCVALPSDPSPCGANASCTYEGASTYKCACNLGYEGYVATCARNACVQLAGEAAPCSANQDCTPTTPGQKTCACSTGFADCDAVANDGCEINTTNDPENCGSCGFRCATGLACKAGACADRVKQMALGLGGTCALKPDGSILCWGDGALLYKQNQTASNVPVLVTDLGMAVDISVGQQYGCVIRDPISSGHLSCWGSNAVNRLGGTDTSSTYQDLTLAGLRSVSAGSFSACAVDDSNGTVYCWGIGQYGALGDGNSYSGGTGRPYSASTPVITVTKAYDVGVGQYISCARAEGGQVFCWGDDLGSSTTYSPELVATAATGHAAIDDATALCVGLQHGCALRNGSTVVCWGNDGRYQLGTTTAPSVRNTFVTVDVQDVAAIACGAYHSCALARSGIAYCWGDDLDGELGDGDGAFTNRATPQPVAGLDHVAAIYSGSSAFHTCARLTNGSVYCWGQNDKGQLGNAAVGTNADGPQEITHWQ